MSYDKGLTCVHVIEGSTYIGKLKNTVAPISETIESLQSTITEQEQQYGLLEVTLNHNKTLLESCEKALEERDIKIAEQAAHIQTLDQFISRKCNDKELIFWREVEKLILQSPSQSLAHIKAEAIEEMLEHCKFKITNNDFAIYKSDADNYINNLKEEANNG